MTLVLMDKLEKVADNYRAIGRSRDEFLTQGWDAIISRAGGGQPGSLRPSDMFYQALSSGDGAKLGNHDLKTVLEEAWPEPDYGDSVQALCGAIATRAQAWIKAGYSITLSVAQSVEEQLAEDGWLLTQGNKQPAKTIGWDGYLVDDKMSTAGPFSSAKDALVFARQVDKEGGSPVLYGLYLLSHTEVEALAEVETEVVENFGPGTSTHVDLEIPFTETGRMSVAEPKGHILPEAAASRRYVGAVDNYGTIVCHFCGLGTEPPTDGTMEYVSIMGSQFIHCHNACRIGYLEQLANQRAEERRRAQELCADCKTPGTANNPLVEKRLLYATTTRRFHMGCGEHTSFDQMTPEAKEAFFAATSPNPPTE